MATLTIPPVLSSPRDDAMQLYRAFKGLGCDVPAVINILAHRDATQRALIQQEYRTIYSEDILKRLVSELTGKLETAILLWMHDPAGRDAVVVRQALMSAPINFQAVTEVICSRTPSQIQVFKQHYHSKFGVPLERDIEQYTSGDLMKLLLAYVSTPRHEGLEVDRYAAEHDAKALFKAGEKKLGTDEKTFIRIFSERSSAHLAAVNAAYHNMYGNSLKKVIFGSYFLIRSPFPAIISFVRLIDLTKENNSQAVKDETSGYFELGLLTILRCSANPAKYFAKVLHKAMKGVGTDDNTLIRVIVTRTEIDMQYIKAEYLKKHKKTLNDEVHSETSGHYRTFLLSLLGPTNH